MTDDGLTPPDRRWRWDKPVTLRWVLVDEYYMGESDAAVAICADIEGVFVDAPSAAHAATLLGCLPQPPLHHALDALARGAGNPGGALRRRRINTSLYSVAEDGVATRVVGAYLQASVTGVRPSTLGHGLLDVTFDTAIVDPMPSGARRIWDLWRAGRPTEPGLWAGYDRELRHQWSGAARAHHRHDRPDNPAGSTYHLDGRDITDVEGFYCAIGEAINGPGGYFGWNADALYDCVTGGWGAAWPFRLVWHGAGVARTRLNSAAGQGEAAAATTFEQLLRWLTEDGIEVELR
ncbi:barstar family protein [Micromonospora sp. U56]|uniref:barstar family protein n=1 Tax=Micromonospora sp. U56 TaxID=2824900 RepID=UPI0027DBEB25|nr:barstar family protein [Micromonospora sp. U56]